MVLFVQTRVLERRFLMTKNKLKKIKDNYKDYVILNDVIEFSIEEDDNEYLWEGYCDEINVDSEEADEITLLVVGYKKNKLKINK